MSDIVIWIIIGIVAVLAVVALVCFLVKFFKMKPEERKELIVEFLIGLVTLAEGYFDESGAGKEKAKWVEDKFNATAPWFLKIVLRLTKSADLHELIEKALDKAKTTLWDKNKKGNE